MTAEKLSTGPRARARRSTIRPSRTTPTPRPTTRSRRPAAAQSTAAWYYRDKTPFETKYAEDCGRDGKEPAWVSDHGEGAETVVGLVSYAPHGDKDCADDASKPSGRTSDWNRRRKSALERVRRRLPHALETLKLIVRNRGNRKESTCSLV